MLALAIEFSRCPKVRTLKAEQRDDAGMHPRSPRVRPEGLLEVCFEGCIRRTSQCINLESSGMQSWERMSLLTGMPKAP
jgi:hypothetical protein